MSNWHSIREAALGTALQTFGEAVTFYPNSGTPVSEEITAVFESSYEAVDPDTGALIQSEQPRLQLRISDLTNPPERGDEFELESGDRFRVHRVEKDAEGGAALYSFEDTTP